MKYEYTTHTTPYGVVLLVPPAVFAHRVNTTYYHLYASGTGNLVKVPVIYVEGDTLFVHELWPFKLAELPEEAAAASRVVAMYHTELRRLIDVGYTRYAADKIKGE